MCSVSMVMDDWQKRGMGWPNGLTLPGPSRAEFELLKAEVEELKAKLKEARKEDIETGAEDCNMKESIEVLRKLAKQLGVDLEDVFDGHKE